MAGSDSGADARGARPQRVAGAMPAVITFPEHVQPRFGELLRRYRLRAGLSQAKLAERAALSERGISDLERGLRARPQAATIGLLAAALGLAPDEREQLAGAARGVAPRPAAPPLLAAPDTLPLPPTRLIGRAEALAAASALLLGEDVPLLTITGPGGVGKSHFALALGHELRPHFRDGGYYAPLAALGGPSTVPTALARALGLTRLQHPAIEDQLAAFLGNRRALLVIDNFEHLLPAASYVEHLLARCANLAVVVTSRAALRLRREREFALPPLALPAALAPQAAIAASSAVRLLAERAGAIRAGFAVTAENARTLAAICRRLDGLPLALELAAARLRLLTPEALLDGLERRVVALRGTAPDLPARHQTLDRMIAWSYDLLAPAEQRLFRHLGVFPGGATLDALAAVGGDGTAPLDAAIDAVDALVAQSMAQIEATDGVAPRLVLLETLRAFALDQLAARGEEGRARDAHAAHYLAALDGADDGIIGPEQARWQAVLADEEQNVRAALAHLAGRGDAEAGLRLWWCIWRFWSDRGQWAEARAWLDRLLALGGPTELRARCLFAGGMVAVRQRDDAAAPAYLQACLALSLEHDFWRWRAAALTQLGHLARRVGDPRAAAAHHTEALDLRRRFGNDREVALSLCGLGFATADLGDLAAAEGLLTEALGLLRAWGDRGEESSVLYELAELASRRGDPEAARDYLAASLERWWQLGAHGRIMAWLSALAARCAGAAPDETLRVLAGLHTLADAWHLPPTIAGGTDTSALVQALRERLGRAEAGAAWAAGVTTDRETFIALATAMIARHAEGHLSDSGD